MPVSAVMLTWWVTTTSTPGPLHASRMARALAVASGSTARLPKKELKTGSSSGRPRKGEFRRVPRTAPLRGEDTAHRDRAFAKGLPDQPRLCPPLIIEIALGGAVPKHETRRVTRARCRGMAEENDGALPPNPRPCALLRPGGRYGEEKRQHQKRTAVDHAG